MRLAQYNEGSVWVCERNGHRKPQQAYRAAAAGINSHKGCKGKLTALSCTLTEVGPAIGRPQRQSGERRLFCQEASVTPPESSGRPAANNAGIPQTAMPSQSRSDARLAATKAALRGNGSETARVGVAVASAVTR